MKQTNLLKTFLLLCALIVGSTCAWADEEIATATFNGKNAIYTEGWTTTGTGVGRTDCIIIGNGENITSPAFDLSGYSKVTISIKARRYGSLSGSKATIDASIGGSSVGTTDATSTSATTECTNITFVPTASMTEAVLVFTCTNATSAGSTHGAGINTITITGTTASTATLESITLSGTYPTTFHQGDAFSHDGIVVTATYSDASTENVTSKATFSTPDMNTLGTKTVTVSYTENEVTKTATYDITITEAVDLVALPFSWDGGGKSALTAIAGITGSGLGTDYADSNAPYLVKFDGTGDYIQIRTDSQPGQVTIGVKMLGGSETSHITVQGSANGTDFVDVEDLTISGSKNDVLTLKTTKLFAATDRYVRLLFTKGSNVGVGPITITQVIPVTISDAGLATFASDSKLDFTNVPNIEAYIAKENGGKIELTQVNKVPAGTGVLLRALNNATDFVVPVTTATADDVTGNLFVRGNDAAVATGSGPYNWILSKKGDVVGFYHANGNTVAKNRAYLQTSTASARISLDFDDNETTGLSEVTNTNLTNNTNEFFDLQGRKVAQPTKGLYIVNGKKVVIK